MPIYEYECPVCNEKFELRRRLADSDNDVKCPRCGAINPRRIFSLVARSHSGGGCGPGVPT